MGAVLSVMEISPLKAGWRRAREAGPAAIPAALALVGVAAGVTVYVLPVAQALLVWGLAATAVLSVIEPLAGLGAALSVAPLQAWLRVAGAPVPAWIGQVFWLLGAGAWVIRGLLRRELRLRLPVLTGEMVLFIGVAWLSLWQATDSWMGFTELGKWLQLAATMVIVAERIGESGTSGAQRRRRCLVAVGALSASGLVQAMLGVWQSALRGNGPPEFAISERFYRAYGTFEQPNPFGGFLGIIGALLVGLVVSAGLAWIGQRRGSAGASRDAAPPLPWLIVGAAILTLLGMGLIASWSRGAWMGFGAALLVIVSVAPRRQVWGWVLVVAVIVGGAAAYRAGWLHPAIADRLTGFLEYTRFEDVRGVGINDANFAVLERMAHWQSALEMARDRFWLGVGLGCYEAAYPAYMLPNWVLPLGHAHNIYLNLFAETGILGLLAYLVLMVSIYVRLLAATRALEGYPRWLAVGLMGAWAHFWVHNLVDNLMVNNVHLHMGVLLALTAWVIAEVRANAAGTNPPLH